MERTELLRRLVMSAIANDYEDFPMVVSTVGDWAKDEHIEFSRAEIINELGDLIQCGHAHAYVLSTQQPYATVVPFSEQTAPDFWYYLTPAGIETLKKLDKQD